MHSLFFNLSIKSSHSAPGQTVFHRTSGSQTINSTNGYADFTQTNNACGQQLGQTGRAPRPVAGSDNTPPQNMHTLETQAQTHIPSMFCISLSFSARALHKKKNSLQFAQKPDHTLHKKSFHTHTQPCPFSFPRDFASDFAPPFVTGVAHS